MIKLSTLLESPAAAQAKSMGLEPAPYGRWKKNGVVTHRTDGNGELVPVKKKGGQNPTAGGPKPTGTSAQQAGTAPSNVPSIDDTIKRQDAARKDAMGGADKKKKVDDKDIGGADGEQEQGPPPVPQNRFRPKDFHPPTTWGKIASSREEIDTHFQDADPNKFSRELIVGETVVIAESNSKLRDIVLLDDIPTTKRDAINSYALEMGPEVANNQDLRFRRELPDNVYDALIKTQNWWQEIGQFDRPEDERNQANNFINSVCNHYKPVTTYGRPIERGMRIPAEAIEDFLSNIAIGEDIEMPPSGFSLNPIIARQFGLPDTNHASVVFRVHPNRVGQTFGLHLTDVNVPKEKAALRKEYAHAQSEFGHEQEFIRPSGCKARCLNVTKVLSKPKDETDAKTFGSGAQCLYIVDFEEQGYGDPIEDPKDYSMYESYDLKTKPNPVFSQYLNTSVGATRSRTLKLKNMMTPHAIA